MANGSTRFRPRRAEVDADLSPFHAVAHVLPHSLFGLGLATFRQRDLVTG